MQNGRKELSRDAIYDGRVCNCLLFKEYRITSYNVCYTKLLRDEVFFKRIKKDGFDSTSKIIEIVKDKHFTKINAIFLDGVTFGGFNISNILEIYEKTKIPVISIMEKEPDISKMIS